MAYKFQLGKAKLSGSIETAQAITSQGGLTVNGDVDLDAGVINAFELATDSVETAKIKNLAVTNDKLAGSIASTKIAELNAFDTADLAEGSNLYYTEARWDAKMAAADTGDLAEGSNLYYTNARARAAVSVNDVSGDGSLTYDNSTGVISYVGPSASEVRKHLGAGDFLTYDSGSGVFSVGSAFTGSARAVLSAQTGSAYQNGNIQYNKTTGQITLQPVEESWVRGRLGAIDAVKYNVGSGQVSLLLSGSSLAQNADGLKADLKTQIGAYDNSGSIAYNAADGRITFNPIAPTWVKGHFSAGAGLDYDSATGAFSVGSAEVTNAMLAGAIENAKLVNSSVTITAGGALTGGGTVALGTSITLDVAVNGDALEVDGDAIKLKSQIAGAREFTGNVVVGGNLTVNGTTTTVNSTQLTIADSLITVAKDQVGFAGNQGLELGDYASLKTAAAVADVGNALSSSLPLVAPSMKAGTFYGTLEGAMLLGVETKSAPAVISKNVTRATANITLTLPSAPVKGQEHRVKCFVADASSPAVVIAAQAGATIEDLASITLESYGAGVSLVWDGTSSWMIF